MDQAVPDQQPIAENFLFVFSAYVLAFGTWSLLSNHDFLSSSWKTVAHTRKRGRQHLAFVCLPMAYMCAYMHYQFKAADYKEFSAALVAFGFAVLHMARTIMGLWQLHVFKQWAVASILSMESLGVRTETVRGKDVEESIQRRESAGGRKERVNKLADDIKVNDAIVENRLFEGEFRCYVRMLSKKQENDIAQAGNRLNRILLLCMYRITGVVRFFGIVWPLVFSKSCAFSTPKSAPYLEPRQPEELYLRWAMVLVSRAFPEWTADMKEGRFNKVVNQESDYATHRDRFALQVLCSAAAHTERPSAGSRRKRMSESSMDSDQVQGDKGQQKPCHRLLPYEEWHAFPKLCSGKFCKDEFLSYACSTGTGLPFAAPHPLAKAKDGKDASYGYSRFRSKLDRARDALPADEAEKVNDLNVEALEWLAVCLCVPDWEPSPSMKSSENVEGPIAISVPPVSEHDNEKPSNEDFDSERSKRTDMAVLNLTHQLGFDLDSKTFLALFSNPFLKGAEDCILWGNRNVLEASVHVDNWLAICAGKQMGYMASKIPDMEIGALVLNSENGGTWKECSRFEQLRFMFQISVLDPEHAYFDQSLSFKGVSMENLRSMLAKWVEVNGQAQPDVWTPLLKSQSCDERDTEMERSVEFTASSDFETLLNGITNEESFSMQFVKMCTLWELQNKLQSVLNKHVSCPGQTEALMLCLLSFPALCFEVKKKQSEAGIEGASALGGGFCCITIEKEENAAFDVVDCIVSIKAALSPQPVHVDVSFSRAIGDAGVVVTARLQSGESDAERVFDWELWRDAFSGSLEGIRLGMEKHGFRSLPVFQGKRSIAEGTCDIDTSNSGTGSIMKTWAGWLPWNPSICKYEIMSAGFVLQLKEVGVTSRTLELQRQDYTYDIEVSEQKYGVVPYDAASGHALQHASMVAHDILRRAIESTSFPLDGWNSSSEDICGRADNILKSGKTSDTDAALVLYEIAASELGNTHALCRAIEILSGEKHGSEAEKRAVTLLERFYLTDCGNNISRGRSKSLRNRFQDKEWVAFVQSQFKILIGRAKCSSKAVMSYAVFCILLFNFTAENALDEGVPAICKAIVQSLQLKGSLVSLQLRRSLMRLIRTDIKELFYLGCAVYRNMIQFLSSNKGEEPGKTERTDKNPEAVVVLFNLARLLAKGADGVAPDPLKAAFLYTRAVEEGAHVDSMINLALLLENSGDGVPPDPLRAVHLYTRAIEEGSDVTSMYNLALLLENGAEGVLPDPLRAVDLYTRAIDEGADGNSMHYLAWLLENGAERVPPDPLRAVDLYTRAIEEGSDVASMKNLALLLQYGADGVVPKPLRAMDLYTRAIEEDSDVASMKNLAFLLQYGADGVVPNPLRAVDLYTRAIDEGADANSMFNLALLLQYGAEGVPPDPLGAVDLYTRAIDESADIQSIINLAHLLGKGADGMPPDPLRAMDLYYHAINEYAYVPCMHDLAHLLENGADGVPCDPLRAVDLYSRAINEWAYVPSMNNLALLLQSGADRVPPDPLRAVHLYNRAIDEGAYVLSMHNLGHLLENGADGVPPDPLLAVDLYTRAIEEGAHGPSIRNLAMLLENGADGVTPNPLRAVDLYTRAIEEDAGAGSMHNLAVLLHNGSEGVPPNAVRAANLYTRAIEEHTCTESMHNLAVLYQNGAEGVPPDAVRSVYLYTRAIEEGDRVDSMHHLAVLLQDGAEGVPPDLSRAIRLHTRVIEEGAVTDSMYKLAQLLEGGCNDIHADMPRAIVLYTRAWNEGKVLGALMRLASIYRHGADVVQSNTARSAELYKRAIEEHESIEAMFFLGVLLEEGGDGVSRNREQALELYRRAVSLGNHEDAAARLNALQES